MEIQNTKRDKPPRIVLYGDHGVGKSELAAAAPNPIFIDVEDGLDRIDTKSLPRPENFEDVLAQLTWIYKEDHGFETLIIDSLDWLETLINKHVCRKGGKESIADFGYGKGHQAALEQFGRVVNALTAIRNEKDMIIILLCHSQVKEYKNPTGENYDIYKLKLRDKVSEVFAEFATIIGFLHFNVHVKKEDKGFGEQTKAIGGTQRILSCHPHAAFTSKNRYGITADIQLPSPTIGWQNLISAIKGVQK